ncbi:hypothetical protein HY29_17770 [Hyphomonas beringensis]|uniref:Tyrosinase copper-binding domain-containing protein n=1 Tax=Hyphomonas beringensis TaxID=1280946 RepID=A0A062U9V8_9PROT|nr:tyrosinase family protein [Hyphomonas beringensis]KCZ52930.1 hypothetical protein HY29_17770 [Hyphomonas beringensis]
MEHPIEFPTYEEHIKDLFTQADKGCMRFALDLSTYDGVMEKANQILSRVKAGTMPPPDENRRWSAEQVETFENWVKNGFQRVRAYLVRPSNKQVVRKDLLNLTGEEIALLQKAFQGLRDRDSDISDKFSFFNLAGIHWYPGPRRYIHCRHHDNEYNPWHRAYLIVFENALRSIEGCETVTLPYWDILGDELPNWVFEEPFFPYSYPHDLLDFTGDEVAIDAGTPIQRFSAAIIKQNIFARLSPVPSSISTALAAPTWERFNGWSGSTSLHNAIIEAHDNGHGACGPTISRPSTAAFDPHFWFFHCNWDRLWWKWQTEHRATSIALFKSKLEEADGWLDNKPSNILKPFNVRSLDMIDSASWNVGYEAPSRGERTDDRTFVMASGRALGAEAFKISSLETVSVRVKNINRLKIIGSFAIDLNVNGETIRSTRIFQPDEASECDTCQKKGIFSKDFLVQRDELPPGAEIRVRIRRFLIDGREEEIPLSEAGNPNINVRFLLDQE